MSEWKQRFLDRIGYDPHVTAAASSTHALAGLTKDLPQKSARYVKSLFPFTNWILHYNLTWGFGDLIAGITVGLVVIPQGMSYAKIATLPSEYGLYSSFVGVMVYTFFATSKDVTIGPVAVLSLQVSKVIAEVRSQPGGEIYTGPVIATALAFFTGIIVLVIGLLRLGWLVEFIPGPAVAGFMTGSALSIIAGQIPGLLGYSELVDTRTSTFDVLLNSIKNISATSKDAVFGIFALVLLYFIRSHGAQIEAKARNPILKRLYFFVLTLRTAFTIILLTIISWMYLRSKPVSEYDISILKTVPSGFRHVGSPSGVNRDLLRRMAPMLPVSTIILILEHIAIAKSFGRINNYKIAVDQELIAIGVTNTIGTLLSAYPATGSFSRSAIKSKAGVRTPLAGWATGVVVVIALYGMTKAFYWIPTAGLSAVIIHAVSDLVGDSRQAYSFWKASPLEAIVWFVGVVISVISSIENGIYVSVAASCALMLYRIARPRGHFLGRVRVHTESDGTNKEIHRDVFVPLDPDGVRNPLVFVQAPPPGIIIFRFDEAVLYPNASFYSDTILEYAREHTRHGQNFDNVAPGDRPWNDPGPLRRGKEDYVEIPLNPTAKASKPVLRAVILDFSSVSNIDTTSIQNLVDLRRSLERYADREVPFHFATILSPWITRALLAGGFGRDGKADERPLEIAPVIPSGGQQVPTRIPALVIPNQFARRHPNSPSRSPPPTPPNGRIKYGSVEGNGPPSPSLAQLCDLEASGISDWSTAGPVQDEQALVSTLHPRFHLDLPSAVNAVVQNDEW
ncbi:sulfate permease [Meredithblackwellia eburnea MCA 4105]